MCTDNPIRVTYCVLIFTLPEIKSLICYQIAVQIEPTSQKFEDKKFGNFLNIKQVYIHRTLIKCEISYCQAR